MSGVVRPLESPRNVLVYVYSLLGLPFASFVFAKGEGREGFIKEFEEISQHITVQTQSQFKHEHVYSSRK